MKRSALKKLSSYNPESNSSKLVKIGEASELIGVSIDTLRRWEKKGWLKVTKTPGGTRLYDREQLQKLNPNLKRGPKSFISPLLKASESSVSIIPNFTPEESYSPIAQNPSISISLKTDQPILRSFTRISPELINQQLEEELEVKDSLFFNLGSSLKEFNFNLGKNLMSLLLISALLLPITLLSNYIKHNQTVLTLSEKFNQTLPVNKGEKLGQVLSEIFSPIVSQRFFGSYPTGSPPGNGLAQKLNGNLNPASKRDLGYINGTNFSRTNGQVLAESSPSGSLLQINLDTQINGIASISGLLSAPTINTGFGDNEVYPMNQPLLTTSEVSFASVTGGTLNLTSGINQLKLGNTTISTQQGGSGAFAVSIPTISAADTFALLNAAQTLTNKSLSGSANTFTNLPNSALTNSKITISTSGTLSGGGSVELGGSITITGNSSGVTSITGTANQVIASASSGDVTLSLPQDIDTSSTPTFAGLELDGSTSGTVTIEAAAATTDYTLTLPANGGTNNYVLATDGNGTTSWQAVGGGVCSNCVITDPSTTQTITPTAATAIGLSVAQASGGSVDIFNVTNNGGGTKYFKVDSSGNTTIQGSTVNTGTFTSSSTVTAQNGLTQTTGALNLTATSGALTLSGLSASSIDTGANNITFTSGNFTTTATGINSTAIGQTTAAAGSFTTLSSTGVTTIGNNSATVAINSSDWDIDATGAITNATYEGLTISTTTGTLTIASGKTFTASNSLTFTGTDGTSFAFPGTSDTVVTLTASQTLTNKSLTSPTITGSPTAAGATWTDLGTVTTADINGGTIDGTVIGGTTAAAGSFTTLTASSGLTVTTGNVAITAGALTLNGATRIANDGIATLVSGTTVASQTFTTNNIADSGPLTIKSATTNALTLDSGTTGTINIGTGSSGKTINIGTDNSNADTVNIGSALDSTVISGTTRIAGLTTNGPVYTSGGNGTLNTEAQLATSRGGTGQDFSGTAQGSLPYFSATGTISALAPSTAGYVLSTNGAGANPSWIDAGGLGVRWNNIVSPSGNQTLAMANYTTTWNWATATTGNQLTATANALTTGTLFNLSSTSTEGDASKLLNLSRSGTNSTASKTNYGLYSEITNTGTTSTNVAGYFSASGGTNNYAAIFENGNVGIGTTSPSSKLTVAGTVELSSDTSPTAEILYSGGSAFNIYTSSTNDFHLGVNNSAKLTILGSNGNIGIGDTSPAALFVVGSGDLFQVNASGAIAAATGITSSGTINFSGLTASSGVYTDGSKNLTSTPPSSGTLGYWSRTGTTLSPANSGDNVTTSGNISTTGSGTGTFASTLTASNGFTQTTGALSLTSTSGAINSTGLSAATLSVTSGTLALATATSGDITLTTGAAAGLANILTGNLKVGDGTPGTTLDGEDAYIEGTLEVDGHSAFGNNTATSTTQVLKVQESVTDTGTTGIAGTIGVNPTGNTSATYQAANLQLNANTAFNYTGILYGLRSDVNSPAAATGTISDARGLNSVITNAGASPATITTAKALYAEVTNSNTGTITAAYGTYNDIYNTSSGTIASPIGSYSVIRNTSTGTITQGIGIQVASAINSGGGTFTTNYGLHVAAQTAGSSDYGARIDAADTQTLWISGNADNTTAAAGIAFGQSRDTNLYRSAVDTLKTDDSFVVGTNLTVSGGTIDLSSAATNIAIKDDTASAFTIKEGSNSYFDITTTNNSESLSLDLPAGGATTLTANLFTSNIAKTINLGTGTAADTIHIGEGGSTANTITIGSDAVANTITIGSSSSTGVSITDDNWSITAAGLITTASNAAINGGTISTTASTAALFNTNAATLSIGGGSTTALNIGNGNSAYTAINIGSGTGGNVLNLAGTGATGADTVNIGTGGTAADTINIGNNASSTALNFTSGTGSQTFTSSVSTGTTTGSAFVFNASSLSSGTALRVTSTSTSGKLFDLNASNTSGTIFNLGYGAVKTLSGDLTGFFVDLDSGQVDATNQNLTGVNFKIPTVTDTHTSGTKTLTGMLVNFGNGAGINQNGAGGTLEYVGGDYYLPALTQTAGTLNAYGTRVITPATITTGGTAYGNYISATGVGAGSLSGVGISSITAGAGTEYALNVGTGWDAALRVGSTTVIDGSGVTQVAGGGTGIASYTAGDLLYATGTTTLAKRAIGNNNEVLAVVGGVPTWTVVSGSSCTNCLVNNPTATQTISPTNDSTGLSVRQTSSGSPTADIFNVTDSTGSTKYFYVDKDGNVSTGSISNTTLTLTPTTNTTALTLVGTNVTSAKNQYINTKNSSGTISDISYGAAQTLAGTIIGHNIDLNTNVTATNQSATGQVITLPAATNTSGTQNYKGLVIAGGALNENGGTATTFTGADITIPALTGTSGTLTAYGANITTPSSITTAGTAYGLNIAATGVGAGTLNGINISNITGGAGTETGLTIGSGWDTNLLFNDTTTNVAIANGGTITILDSSGNSLCTITDAGTTGNLDCTGTIGGTGTVGFWSRDAGTGVISPATSNDVVAISSNKTSTPVLALTSTGATSNAFSLIGNSVTTGNLASLTSTGMTTGEALNIDGTWAPTDGSTNEAIDINLTHTPTSAADTFRGIDLTITDGTSLDNVIQAVRSSITTSSNAAKISRAFEGNVTSSSTTADTLNAGYFSTSATGNAARTGNIALTGSATTSSTTADNLIGVQGSTSATGILTTGTRNNYGLVAQPLSTAASTGGTNNLYGAYINPSSTLSNPGASDTATNNVFGLSITTVATIAADCGASCATSQYGILINDGTSSTNGTSNKVGLQISAQTGADTNVSARIDASSTQTLWVSGNANNTTAAAGIAFGSSRDTNLYRSAADTLYTDDNFTSAGTVTAFSTTNEFVAMAGADGQIELSDSSDDFTYVDFKNLAAEDYDGRIGYSSATNTFSIHNAGSVTATAQISATTLNLLAGTNLTLSSGTGVYTQTYSSTGTPFTITANSITTGTLMNISGTGFTTGRTFLAQGTWSTTDTSTVNGAQFVATNNPSGASTFRGLASSITDTGTVASATSMAGLFFNNGTGNAAKNLYGAQTAAWSSSTTADNTIGLVANTSVTGVITTGTRTSYGLQAGAVSTAASTAGTQQIYGGYFGPSSTGSNPGTGNTTTNLVYGVYTNPELTVASDCTSCTSTQYGLYAANGTSSTNGTSTKYGIFVGNQTGADTNYHLYVNALSNATSGVNQNGGYFNYVATPGSATSSSGGGTYYDNIIGNITSTANGIDQTNTILRSGVFVATYAGDNTLGNISGSVHNIYNTSTGTIGTTHIVEIALAANSGVMTNTMGLYIGDITAGTQTNQAYSIYAADTNARNYLAGNMGIGGDTTPDARLEVGDGTDEFQVSSTGDLTFVDANDGASITGPAGGALAINASATGLNLQADGSIDVNIAGGSSATGCTVTNSTGDLTCTGNITGSGSGTSGFWQRTGTVVSPATNTDSVAIGGTTTANGDIVFNDGGSAVFNEQSGAVDFRIESDGVSNMFVVDGTNNKIGIGASPSSTSTRFYVQGNFTSGLSSYDNVNQFNMFLTSVDDAEAAVGTSNVLTTSHTANTVSELRSFDAENYLGSVMAGGAGTTSVTLASAIFAGNGISGASPAQTIATLADITAGSINNVATGSPAVTVTNSVGVRVANMGTGSGTNGLTITSANGIGIANQTTATNNTNLLIGTLTIPTGTINYSIYNGSAYQNYFAGNLGIGGDATPDAYLEVGDGTDEFQVSSTGDLLFVDANSSASITGPNGGSLSIAAANSQALALSTTTAGDITLTTGAAAGLANILTGNLKVGNGTPGVTLDGEDGYIEGTFEVDGASRFDGAIAANAGLTVAANQNLTMSSGTGVFTQTYSGTGGSAHNITATATATSGTEELLNDLLTNSLSSSATAFIGRDLEYVNSASVSNTDFAMRIFQNTSGGSDTTNALLRLDNVDTDTAVTSAISIVSTTADMIVSGINASDAELTNSLTSGANFVLFDGIRIFEGSTGTLTFEDTSGNDLCTITDGGTTGALACTGNITGPTTGTIGYWARNNGTSTLSPATANDIVSIANTTTTGADFAITNTGIYTGTGLAAITANSATTGDILTISATALTTGTALTVTGNASAGMTDSLVKFTADVGSGTSMFRLSPDFSGAGVTGYGVLLTGTDATTSGNTDYGIYGQTNKSGIISTAVTDSQFGVVGQARSTAAHTAGTEILYGVAGIPISSGATTGSTTVVYGGYFENNSVLTTGGTLTSAGIRIRNDTSIDTTGTTTQYGILIDPIANADTNYSLYSNGGDSYFKGNVGFNDTTPSYRLDITDAAADGRAINIAQSGAGTTTYGLYSSITGAPSNANIAGYFSAAGTSTNEREIGVQIAAGTLLIGTDFSNVNNEVVRIVRSYGDDVAGTLAGIDTSFTYNGGATMTAGYGMILSPNAVSGGGSAITANYGLRVNAATAGTNNAGMIIYEATGADESNLILGQTTIPSGNFSLYSASADASYFAGNVGIGTSAPLAKLQVTGTARVGAEPTGRGDIIIDQTAVSTSGNGGLEFKTDANGSGYGARILGILNAGASGYDLTFQTRQSSATWSNRMTIDGVNGNVGIGNTTPAGKLDVLDTSNTAASFTLANNTATTIGNGANTLGVIDLQSTSLTTGNFMNMEVNALTTGKGINLTNTTTLTSGTMFNLASASTALTGSTTTGSLVSSSYTGTAGSGFVGNLNYFDYSPSSAPSTSPTGDLVRLHLGANATNFAGNFFNLVDDTSSVFSVSKTAFTTSLPSNFTAAGDVSIAYDINFTNPTASYIKSAAPLNIYSGETFNSSNLNLGTYNQGTIVFDTANTTTTALDFTSSTLTTGTGFNIATSALTTGNAVSIAANALTTGNALNISSTTTSTSTNKLINLSSSGNTSTGTRYGLYSDISGTGTANIGGYFSASGGTANYGLLVAAGNVGIGDTTPDGTLDIQLAAGGQILIDAATTDNTTSSPFQLTVETSTTNNIAMAVSSTSIADAGNDTIYGMRSDMIINSDASGVDTGINLSSFLTVTDANSTGYGLYVDAGTGAGTEYAAVFLNGNVGIGATPSSFPLTISHATANAQVAITDTTTSPKTLYMGAQWLASTPTIGTNTTYGLQLATNNEVEFSIASGGQVAMSLPGTQTGNAVCHTNTGTTTSPDNIVDCTGALSDYAERYPVSSDIEYGDILFASGNYKTDKSGVAVPEMVKSNSAYQNVIGVASDNYNDFSSIGDNYDSSINIKPIALAGRVPVKVTLENGPIKRGDFITTSSTPGKGMKATHAGPVIGTALADYNGGGNDTVEVFIKATYADPNNSLANLTIDSNGDLVVPEVKAGQITVSGSAVIGGLVSASNFALDASLLNMSGSLASVPVNASGKVTLADTVNALSSSQTAISNQVLGLESENASQSAQIAQNNQIAQQAVAQAQSLDEKVASTSGRLASLSSQLSDLLASLGGDGDDEATPSGDLGLTPPTVLQATDSATFKTVDVTDKISTLNLGVMDATVSATFKSLGQTFLGQTTIAGDLSVDGTFSVTDGKAINAFPTLFLQSNPLAENIDIFNGKVTINKDGQFASESLALGNQSLGSTIIPAGQTEVIVDTTLIASDSKVFLTPTSLISGNLYVGQITSGQKFKVKLSEPNLTDVKFNWLIIQSKEASN